MIEKLTLFKDQERGGTLIPFEFFNMPFEPKRIYMVTGIPKGAIRGEHAHHETQQILICAKGQIIVYLDNGSKVDEFILNEGDFVFMDKLVWDYQKFMTDDDVMVVISSTHYDISDYITDKDEFYKIIKSRKLNEE